MERIRDTQGGRDYDASFGRRMRGEGIWARLIAQRFERAVVRNGLATRLPPLRCDLFRVPLSRPDQPSLF